MIVLPAAVLGALRQAAEAAYPNEACGLLVGEVRPEGTVLVARLEPSANLAARPGHAFEIDPRLRLMLQRRLRGTPEAVVGLYHSHPDGSAWPSTTDLENAWEPELVWLICAVAAGRAGEVRAHRLDQPRHRFEELRLATAAEEGGRP